MRYAHTTIIVSDIEKSIQFYEEVAGLTIRNKFSAGSKTLAFLSDKDGDTQIELIQDENEKTYSGSGISIGFEVENVEEYGKTKFNGISNYWYNITKSKN